MSEFSVEEMQHCNGAKIKVVGCGGGGGNMLNHMARSGLNELDLIAINTDSQALASSLAKTKIQVGDRQDGYGLGAGGKPEVGAAQARHNFEEIKAALSQSDIVFLASGFGGGTGTGASPIVAQAAKEVGALTVSVITMPFAFEGKDRRRTAEAGLAELKKESDSILVIQNTKLLSFIDKRAGIKEAFKYVDEILTRAVKGMVSILLEAGDINVDFADVRTIMSYRGLAIMGIGQGSGDGAVEQALANALESPLLDGMDIKGAKGVIIHFRTSPDCSLIEISEAAASVEEVVDENAKIIFGTTSDEAMEDMVEITIIATGFEERSERRSEGGGEEKKNPFLNIKKVSGGLDEEMLAQIETPTFLRRQMD